MRGRWRPQLLHGQRGGRLRLGPSAADARNLRAVDPAEPHDRGLGRKRLAPHPGRAPIAGAADVAQLEARLDQRAVDDAREVRGDGAGQDQRHGLVHPRKPVGDPTNVKQQQTLDVQRHRKEVVVREALGTRDRLFGVA